MDEVAPEIIAVPLYHCQVLDSSFSVSASGSEKEPLTQVRVLPADGVPEMVGTVNEGMWSGYSFVEIEEFAMRLSVSLNVIAMDALAGVVAVQVRLIERRVPTDVLEALVQVPALIVWFQFVMSAAPSASSA